MKNDRTKLILQAHNLGHFAIDSTLKRLIDDYFWRRMRDDVQYQIERCITCQRNKPGEQLEHMAKATLITGLFDKIVMDVVGGLPESNDGYVRILVITDFM